jgi:2-haloacid dehalogenase
LGAVGIGRRHLLQLGTAAAAMPALGRTTLAEMTMMPAAAAPVKAIGFDGFVIFDPQPIAALAETLFPGAGAALSSLWRTRQFEYCWLRTVMGRYADFWSVTEASLIYAAAALKLDLTPERRDRLMQAYLAMKAHPDVLPGLQALRTAGIRLGFISNLTQAMLESATRSAGLDGYFEQFLSTDRVSAYKPDPRAYAMGIDGFGLRREEILFAAFGGWDAAGAKSFGYRTFWCNRQRQPVEQLGAQPDAIGYTVGELAHFALGA